MLIDVLLHEQLRDIFTEARERGQGLNAHLLDRPPSGVDDPFGGRGATVRIATTAGGSLLVTPRGIHREVGEVRSGLVRFDELVGYDWITPEMSEKVEQKEEHFDRLYLHVREGPSVVLDHLGDAVYPMITFLGKVVELRSQKVILRHLDDDVSEIVSVGLRAAAEGPFFDDDELPALFELDRASLTILAATWQRMNLASPDLRRIVATVLEMLVERRARFPDAWDRRVAVEPERFRSAVEIFRRVARGDVG